MTVPLGATFELSLTLRKFTDSLFRAQNMKLTEVKPASRVLK